MKSALLLIDIQNEYFPGGKRELVNPLQAAQKAFELLQCFREHKQRTVHIQQIVVAPRQVQVVGRKQGLVALVLRMHDKGGGDKIEKGDIYTGRAIRMREKRFNNRGDKKA